MTWTLEVFDECGCVEQFEFDDEPDASDIFETYSEWVQDGDWGLEGASIKIYWELFEDDCFVDEGSDIIDVEPSHSDLIAEATYLGCGEYYGCGHNPDDHDWTAEGEAGCTENPGVWSLGGRKWRFIHIAQNVDYAVKKYRVECNVILENMILLNTKCLTIDYLTNSKKGHAMQTSHEWWDKVKQNNSLLLDWLHKQYHGEMLAAIRMKKFIDEYGKECVNNKWLDTVNTIANQESQHAQWIGELLLSRGELPSIIDNKEERYWNETLKGIDSWDTGCAVAAHAENMRLERIQAIVDDISAPEDIRQVFTKILAEEQFHALAFESFSTDEALSKTKNNHELGMKSLGLTI